ncbi:MAG TPA: hypothetical protein VEI97_05300, partial [bacterium]|nr:hypothetical protein [bacterium]
DRIAVLLDRQLKALGAPDDIRSSPDPLVQRFIHGELEDGNALAQVLKDQEARAEHGPPAPTR